MRNTIAVAVIIAALAAPAAQARPAEQTDMRASVATALAQERTQHGQRSHPLGQAGNADFRAAPAPASSPASSAPVVATDGNDFPWTTLGLGLAGAVLLAGSGAAVVAGRRRVTF